MDFMWVSFTIQLLLGLESISTIMAKFMRENFRAQYFMDGGHLSCLMVKVTQVTLKKASNQELAYRITKMDQNMKVFGPKI